MSREIVQKYISLRRSHSAWLLLASPKGPLILASLKHLIESNPTGVDFDEAVEKLAAAFADHANDSEFELGNDHALEARKELRQWLKRGLIVERGGKILATDAFQRSLMFLESLEDRTMTSTASRLATVQRAIEVLDSQLSRSQSDRVMSLQVRIEMLSQELKAVQAGNFEVLDGSRAEEGIREVYQLAISLPVDFRRVEDSYREADRILRQRIISENQNRGEVVDELLNGHAQLVQTVEGQVFESFYAQLVKSSELQEMKTRLRAILENANTDRALGRKQKAELRQLVSRLVQESERVIQARARSEKDVRGFLKAGLADEQMRVGALLQEIFQVALELDWQSQKVRRSDSPLPPIAISIANLPVIERLLPKQMGEDTTSTLDLEVNEADPNAMDDEFWNAYHALNRTELFRQTLEHLQQLPGQPTIGDLARALPPSHDLETLAFWLSMARQAGIPLDEATETIDLANDNQEWTRFTIPTVKVNYAAVKDLKVESLE
ncbi:MAG: DUF3375 domain-containing protein [Pirellulaceae bacterium]|nr:DUF3375 domain-containing protein [Pirellulaceae bacterium]